MPAKCDICEIAEEHGYYKGFGSRMSHCDKCHRSWTGRSENHCTGCCRHFGGEVAFNAHQTHDKEGNTICSDPTTAKRGDEKPRFRPIERVDGIVWVQAKSGTAERYRPSEKPAKDVAAAREGRQSSVVTLDGYRRRKGAA